MTRLNVILAGVEPRETGSAGGTLTAVQQLGGSLGIAILGAVFFSAVGGDVIMLVVEAALAAAASQLVYLLPRRARPQEEGAPAGH